MKLSEEEQRVLAEHRSEIEQVIKNLGKLLGEEDVDKDKVEIEVEKVEDKVDDVIDKIGDSKKKEELSEITSELEEEADKDDKVEKSSLFDKEWLQERLNAVDRIISDMNKK